MVSPTFVAMAISLMMMSYVKAEKNAYSTNINSCLFDTWPADVLSGPVSCLGSQLCYSVSGNNPAQFAVCYNTGTLIPDFTGHVVPVLSGGRRIKDFHNENGVNKPDHQSAIDDYKIAKQVFLFPNYAKRQQRYCSKGHLTPQADFVTADQRTLTNINTNIAPQWQPFNGGNWAGVEAAVKNYAVEKQRPLYVFTGTAGVAKVELLQGQPKVDVKLNGKVQAPEYYWKVVCDPEADVPPGKTEKGQSVVIIAANNIGDISETRTVSDWDANKTMTGNRGIIKLYSWDEAKKIQASNLSKFNLPPLGVKCNTDYKGTFLNEQLSSGIKIH